MFVRGTGTIWGEIPQTSGSIYWVAPSSPYTLDGRSYSSSNDNDGKSPERALATVARALVLADSGPGDVIALLPGTHTTTATLTINKNNLRILGIRGKQGGLTRPITTLTTSGTVDLITISAGVTGLEIAWLNFIPITAKSAVNGLAGTIVAVNIHHCSFDMFTPVASTSTIAINTLSSTNTHWWVHDNTFLCDGAQGPTCSTRVQRLIYERNVIQQSAGTWASMLTHGTVGLSVIRDNQLVQGTTATTTTCINGSGATVDSGAFVARNIFTANSNPTIDNFSANKATIALNYETDPGGTAGGTLVVVIT